LRRHENCEFLKNVTDDRESRKEEKRVWLFLLIYFVLLFLRILRLRGILGGFGEELGDAAFNHERTKKRKKRGDPWARGRTPESQRPQRWFSVLRAYNSRCFFGVFVFRAFVIRIDCGLAALCFPYCQCSFIRLENNQDKQGVRSAE
jgi:hypothetical protein